MSWLKADFYYYRNVRSLLGPYISLLSKFFSPKKHLFSTLQHISAYAVLLA
jgi:hypothetical protein